MAQFSVKTKQARAQAADEFQMARELESMEDSVRSISNNLGFKIASKANIRARLRNAASRIDGHQRDMRRMNAALTNILDDYDKTEQRLLGNSKLKEMQKRNEAGSSYSSDISAESLIEKYIKPLLTEIDGGEYQEHILNRLDSIKEFIAKVYQGDISQLGALLTIPELIKEDIEAFDGFIDNIKDTIIEKTGFEAEAKTEGALYEKELSCENGSLGVSISAYEAYASAEGGLYTKDDEGNLVLNPHVTAEIGASYTVFSAAGQYGIGNEMLGADVSGNITAGQVSGKVEASASLMDEDGTFNPHAKLDASAEAILVDASAQAGVTVLGTEVKAEGSVNVGIGAHASVEIGDGVIECDIGASLGIGASLKFSIDYGGTVDAIKDGCKSVLDKIFPW